MLLSVRPEAARLRTGMMGEQERTRIVEPLIPPGKPGGGKRRVAIREVING